MTNIDQFESVFRSAVRERFPYAPIEIANIAVVTDLSADEAARYVARERECLAVLNGDDKIRWEIITGDQFRAPSDVLRLLDAIRPDAVCTYRNLHSDSWRYPYSLGTFTDLLTQHTDTPVFLLPHPQEEHAFVAGHGERHEVVVVTRHIAQDPLLVNWGVKMTEPGGKLILAHVEDDRPLQRYLGAIAKIPQIDTETAERTLKEKLLGQARDYIASVRDALTTVRAAVTVIEEISLGRPLAEYKRVIESYEADLLVMTSKDTEQLAMDGLAHALAVELRKLPLLLL